MRFEIYWASLIVGSKFTVFALFYFAFEGNFPSTRGGGGVGREGGGVGREGGGVGREGGELLFGGAI